MNDFDNLLNNRFKNNVKAWLKYVDDVLIIETGTDKPKIQTEHQVHIKRRKQAVIPFSLLFNLFFLLSLGPLALHFLS